MIRSVLNLPALARRKALNVLLPLRCLVCDMEIGGEPGLCGACWAKVRFLEMPWCQKLGTPFFHDMGEAAVSPEAIAHPPVFDRLRAVSFYGGPARDLVLGLKFARRRELAVPMATWMARVGRDMLDESLVVPVPLHWTRLWQRRFNQAAELARILAAASGGSYAPECLVRSKRTRQQVGLPAKERQRNVRRAFEVPDGHEASVAGRRVVIVDDVYTTGSTVTACTKALLAAGAASVDVLVFAIADPAHHEDVGLVHD